MTEDLFRDDATFLKGFEDGTLPFAQWQHRSHVRVAYLYLRTHSMEGALERMRRGIQSYNAHHNVPESPTLGYHETMTVAWIRLLHGIVEAHGFEDDFESFIGRHSYLESKMLPLLYYSRERIMSADAKTHYLEPDLAPFPRSVLASQDPSSEG